MEYGTGDAKERKNKHFPYNIEEPLTEVHTSLREVNGNIVDRHRIHHLDASLWRLFLPGIIGPSIHYKKCNCIENIHNKEGAIPMKEITTMSTT